MVIVTIAICVIVCLLSALVALNAIRGAATSISRERELARQEIDRAWAVTRAETAKRVVSQDLIIEIMQEFKPDSLVMSAGLRYLVAGIRGKTREEQVSFLLKGVPHVVHELAKQARRSDSP